jgi:signal transduction histidine kinase
MSDPSHGSVVGNSLEASTTAATMATRGARPAEAGAQADAIMRTHIRGASDNMLAMREHVVALARQSGDPALVADALLWHHRALLYFGQDTQAQAARDESRALAAERQDDAALAHCEVCDAQADEFAGRHVQAMATLKRAWPRLAAHRDAERVRAVAALIFARLCYSLQLYDESIAAAEEGSRLQQSKGDLGEAWRLRYIALSARLQRVKSRHLPLSPLPADDPDVVEVEATVRGLLSGEPARYLDSNYRHLLFSVLAESGREAEAVAVWHATAHVPSFMEEPGLRAEVALHVEGPSRTIEILTPLVQAAAAQGGDAANSLDYWRLLARAHHLQGDHRQALAALRQVLRLSQSMAYHSAQSQAALLALELEREREKLAAQRALIHAGKLAAVGQLAGSMAHEFGQPSAVLMARSVDARQALHGRRWEALADALGDVDCQVAHLGRLVDRMKAFSRDDPLRMERLDLHDVLEEACRLCKPVVQAAHVDYVVNVPNFAVHGDKERVILAVVNLVNNALDAMRGQTDPPPMLRVEAELRDGTPPRVALAVIDNGPGLGEAVRSRLSEPFFTTKSTGLGLGLTITREALAGMHARLEADNGQERGARFSVLLQSAVAP